MQISSIIFVIVTMLVDMSRALTMDEIIRRAQQQAELGRT